MIKAKKNSAKKKHSPAMGALCTTDDDGVSSHSVIIVFPITYEMNAIIVNAIMTGKQSIVVTNRALLRCNPGPTHFGKNEIV